MIRNIRGRLARLERTAPAEGPSMFTNGRFWDLVSGVGGDATPAELAEWEAILKGLEGRPSAGDQVERLLAEVEATGS